MNHDIPMTYKRMLPPNRLGELDTSLSDIQSESNISITPQAQNSKLLSNHLYFIILHRKEQNNRII